MVCFLFSPFKKMESRGEEKLMSSNEILVKYINKNTVETIKLKPDESVFKKIEELNNNPAVDYAEPNYLYEASLIPSDTYYSEQWYLDKIQAPKTWDIARDASDVVIAVIDSGVQINHPDLKELPSLPTKWVI
jgi:subtilisin family serine protease